MHYSRYFCPNVTTNTSANFVESLGSSFCKFHGTSSIRFLRYSSSISLRYHNVVAASGSGSTSDQTPSRSLGFSNLKRVKTENWNKTQKLNNGKEGRFSDLGVMSGENSSGISDGGGSSTMERIVERLKKYDFVEEDQVEDKKIEQERKIEKWSVEERNFSNRRGGVSEELPFGVFGSNGEVKFPWEKVSSMEKKKEQVVNGEWTAKKESRYSLAEMTLPQSELIRLRNLMFRTKSKMRVKGAGVTQPLVDAIQEKWKSSEIVRLKIEGSNALNMRRMHEILEVFIYLHSSTNIYIN